MEFKMTKPRETFHFFPPFQIKGNWVVGLTDLEVYNSIFNINTTNNKLKFFKFPDEKAGGISYTKVRDEIEKDLDISDITAADLQDEILGPIIIEEYREQVTKRTEGVGYMNILSSYPRSVFQDFESYLTTEIDLVEDDIRLVLDKYNSSFITYEISPGIDNFKNPSQALFNILQHEYPESSSRIATEFDDINKKTKLVADSGIIDVKFDEQSFFSTVLGFTSGSDYKHNNKYSSQTVVNSSSTNNKHLKCDCIDGSILDGCRQPILFSFVLDKLTGYKVFCEPETIHYKEINKSVLNTISFFKR